MHCHVPTIDGYQLPDILSKGRHVTHTWTDTPTRRTQTALPAGDLGHTERIINNHIHNKESSPGANTCQFVHIE